MDNYIGKTCPFCQAPFKPGAELVVCNICDMPHHRECWAENTSCTTYGCTGGITAPSRESIPSTTSAQDSNTLTPPDPEYTPSVEYYYQRSVWELIWYYILSLTGVTGLIAIPIIGLIGYGAQTGLGGFDIFMGWLFFGGLFLLMVALLLYSIGCLTETSGPRKASRICTYGGGGVVAVWLVILIVIALFYVFITILAISFVIGILFGGNK